MPLAPSRRAIASRSRRPRSAMSSLGTITIRWSHALRVGDLVGAGGVVDDPARRRGRRPRGPAAARWRCPARARRSSGRPTSLVRTIDGVRSTRWRLASSRVRMTSPACEAAMWPSKSRVAVQVGLQAAEMAARSTRTTAAPGRAAATTSVLSRVEAAMGRAIMGGARARAARNPHCRENPGRRARADKRFVRAQQSARCRRFLRSGHPRPHRGDSMETRHAERQPPPVHPGRRRRRRRGRHRSAAAGAVGAGARRLRHVPHRPVDRRRAGEPGAELPAVGRAAERGRRPGRQGRQAARSS